MGMFADRARKKEEELNKALGKPMAYHSTSSLDNVNAANSIANKNATAPVINANTLPGVSRLSSAIDRAGLAAEKASRVFAQNSPDMYNSTTKQPAPKQWMGPANVTALKVVPGSSVVKKSTAANNRGNDAYLKYAPEVFVPEEIKSGGTVVGPQQFTSAGNLLPYTPNSKPKEMGFKEKFMQTGLNASDVWVAKSMELPARTTEAKQGSDIGSRVYNALSSIGDARIGSDMSLKATAKQSVENEKAYRDALKEYNSTIEAIMLGRNQYPSTSQEYKKYSIALENIYAAIDGLRDKAADMTDANEFMVNAEQLRMEATKGLTGLPLQLADASISVGDNLTSMAITGFNPTATLIMMGAGSAGQKANELSNEGVSAGDAFSRGVLSGVIEGVTEKIGLDNLLDIVGSNNVKLLSSILKQMAAEGGEEGLGNVMNYAADRMSGDNKSFDWDDFSQSVIQGALSGFMFGLGGTAVNVAGNHIGYKLNAPNHKKYTELSNEMMLPKDAQYLPSVEPYRGVTNGEELLKRYVDDYNSPIVEHQNYINQIYDVMTGKMPSNKLVEVMKTPKILQVQSNIDEQSDNVGNQAITTKEFKDVYENENDLIPVERGLSQTDVNAYNFIKKNADNKNTSTNKIYNAYKKGRETLLKSVIDENFEAMKSYSPQGTQLIYSDSYVPDGYEQDVPSGSVQRISNNELWYSEAFKEYGHKPNQAQLKQFIEKKVLNDIKNGGGEYISPENARKMKLFDSLLDGYNKITENGKNTNIININKNENGNYEVSYSDNALNDTVQPKTQTYQYNNALGIVNPDVQALFNDAGKAKSGLKSAYQSTVSGWAPFERMSKVDTDSTRNIAARVNKYAQKGGITDTILTRGLYDNNGNKISDTSFVSVASQVPKADVPAFNDYLQNLHNIDRQVQGKPVNANTAEQSQNIVAQYEINHPEFKEYRKALTDYWDSFVKTWYVDRGLISPDDYTKMKEMYPNYIPTFRVEDGGSGGSGTVNAGKKIIGGKAIGKAKGGTSQVMSFEEAFAKKIQSAISAASKNDISREIYEFAKSMPSEAAKNGVLLNENTNNQNNANIGDIDEAVDVIDKNIAREISKDNFEITFYENGKAKTMKVNRDVYEAYRFLDSKLGDNRAINGIAKLGRFFTNPMRAMTTTYNPLFFMTNIIRDIQTYAINNTAQNSAIAAKNYVKAIAGMAKQAETYNQYKALGGSQNGYIGTDMYKNTAKRFNPNKTTLQKVLSIPKAPLTAMEILGDVTEVVPRYAEYLNTIDTLGNTEAGRLQASLNAADVTVNFNRSSTASTLANAWIPYFNAGLQGMDKTFRQIKAHPVKTTTRAAVSVFLPTILLYLVNKDNPHWKDVKDGVRDNYYLIPNMSGPIDLQGNAETFIRLPKSREYGALMSASFERFMRALDDEYTDASDAFEGYGQTLLNSFMPPDLNDWIGGTAKAIKNNKAWHGGTIVPSNLTKVSPQYQYDINTSGAAMELAKLGQRLPIPGELGQALSSPMKADYWLDSYTGYAGDILQGLTSQRNKGNTPGETLSNSLYSGIVQPFKNRLTTDSAYSSYTLDNFYNKSDEAEIAKNDRNYADNLPSDYVTVEEAIDSAYTKAQSKISDLTKQEKAILASPMPIGEKNKQIRELRQRKNEIAKEMMGYPQQLTEAYNSVYLPAVESVSGIPDYNRMSEEDKNKVMTQITKYASDVAKSRIYPSSYYPDYEMPTYLPKIDEVRRKGVDLGDAIFYRYKLNDIENKGGKNEDKRSYLEKVRILTPMEKNAIDKAFISDYTFIPQDVDVDYSNHENTVLTQMSDSAQRKWDRFESIGLSIDDYVQVYKAATSGTKNERLANLQALGYNYSEALQLYKAATKK